MEAIEAALLSYTLLSTCCSIAGSLSRVRDGVNTGLWTYRVASRLLRSAPPPPPREGEEWVLVEDGGPVVSVPHILLATKKKDGDDRDDDRP